jgi:hypothetical protein
MAGLTIANPFRLGAATSTLFMLVLASSSPAAAPPAIHMVYGVVSIPEIPTAGTPVTLRIESNACSDWIPGWTYAVNGPEHGVITIDIAVDVRPHVCFGGQIRSRDVNFFAPSAGDYTIRVTGGGLYQGSFPPPLPYVFAPFESRVPWTVIGGGPPVTAVPVPVMVPWALGLLAGTVMLGGTLMLRRRRRSD